MDAEIVDLSLTDIRTDGGTQPRERMDDAYTADLAADSEAGASIPPVTVFFDGTSYWLADGFHRYYAYERLGRERVGAQVHRGSQRDAVLFSAGANRAHGLRRTNADKRRAVMVLLNDTEWARWSDREIARRCGVGPDLVGDLRRSLSLNDSEPRTYTTKHGTPATMDTSGIGKRDRVQTSTEPASDNDARQADQANRDRLFGEIDEEPDAHVSRTGRSRSDDLGSRGSFEDTMTLRESFKTIQEMLQALEDLKPKKVYLMEVLEAARSCAARLSKFIAKLERGI